MRRALFASILAASAACGDDDRRAPPPGADSGLPPVASGPDSSADSGPGPDVGVDTDANFAFVTSTLQAAGGLGGLAGADALCNERAAAAGLPGNYVAWLSSNGQSALSRLMGARGWVRTDGLAFVDTTGDLTAGRTFYPLRLDEFGQDVLTSSNPATPVSTGTRITGLVAAAADAGTCDDWTNPDAALPHAQGFASASGLDFTDGSLGPCSTPTRLYCLGTDRNAPTMPVAVTGRRAFVSTEFASGGGLLVADALCQADADAAGLGGAFVALLATTAESASDRLNLDGSGWVRVDGVRLIDQAQDLGASGPFNLVAPVALDARGEPLLRPIVFAGAAAPGLPAAVDGSCTDWTVAVGTTPSGFGNASFRDWFGAIDDDCSLPMRRVYCFEQ